MDKVSREQIAMGSYHYTSWTPEYFIRSVKELGIENVEIWGAKPHFLAGIQSREYLRKTAAKFADAGLKIVCFCPEQNNYPVNISAAENSLRRYSIEHMKQMVEAAAMLGTDTLLLCPGNGYLEEPIEAIRERFVRSAAELARTAADFGIVLALETQAQVDSLFMNTAQQQKEVLEMIDHPHFKVMLDTVQLAQFDRNIEEDIRVLGIDNIQHIHLGNTIVRDKTPGEKSAGEAYSIGRSVCGHIGFREGNLPLTENLHALAKAGYRRYVTIEICQKPYYFEAHRYAREAYDSISEALV